MVVNFEHPKLGMYVYMYVDSLGVLLILMWVILKERNVP
jgi:hypothetical protein